MANRKTSPRTAVKIWTSKNRINESSSRETMASARNNPRQRLNSVARISRHDHEGLRVAGGSGGGKEPLPGTGVSFFDDVGGGNGGGPPSEFRAVSAMTTHRLHFTLTVLSTISVVAAQ